jgi:hypothetical protein
MALVLTTTSFFGGGLRRRRTGQICNPLRTSRFWNRLLSAALFLSPLQWPNAALALDPAVEATYGQIISDVSSQILSKVSQARPGNDRPNEDRTVALTFLRLGVLPENDSCVPRLRAQFTDQSEKIRQRTGMRLSISQQADGATVNFVIGDTRELKTKKTGEVPVEEWLQNAQQKTQIPTFRRGRDLGIPGDWPTNWLQGVYGKLDHHLIYGGAHIHWQGLLQRLSANELVCSFSFVDHLAWLFSLDFQAEFKDQIDEIDENARTRAGITEWGVPARDIQNLILGTFFCTQFVDASRLAACSHEIAQLAAESNQ